MRHLVNQHQGVGNHQVVWDGLDESGMQTANGVYIYRAEGQSIPRLAEDAVDKIGSHTVIPDPFLAPRRKGTTNIFWGEIIFSGKTNRGAIGAIQEDIDGLCPGGLAASTNECIQE